LETKENLTETLTVLVDKGYHNGREIAQCKNNNIITIVAHPTQEELKTAYTRGIFVAKFLYNTIDDTYECPQGETLKLREDGIKNRTHRAWIPI
jgi:hypothetical protein